MKSRTRWILLLSGAAAAAGDLLLDPLLGGSPGFGREQWILLAAALLLVLPALTGTWKRLLLLSASLTAALLLSEGALRLFFAPWFTTLYEPDPVLLHRLVPGAAKAFRRLPVNGGGVHLVRVNSLGFRGKNFPREKRCFRVAVYGDSFVEGEFSPLEETFCRRLETALEQRAKTPVQVVNAGVVGYGPDQCLLKMEEEFPLLEPDLLVVAVYAGNDYGDLIRNRIFRPAPAGGFLRGTPRLAPSLRRAMEKALSPWILPKLLEKGLWFFQARGGTYPDPYSPVEDWLAKAGREYSEYLSHPEAPVTALFLDDYDADLAVDPGAPSSRLKIRLMRFILERTAAFARRRKVPLALLLIPSPLDACPGYDVQVNRKAHPAYRPENLTAPLVRIASELGLPCLDLLEPFREAAREGEDLYFHGTDDHWNGQGQEKAARLLAVFLRKSKLPPFR